jgi:hypothetical protein
MEESRESMAGLDTQKTPPHILLKVFAELRDTMEAEARILCVAPSPSVPKQCVE